MLVIGLIALFTVMVVPNFKPVLHDAQLEQAVQVLQADLMRTRQIAREYKMNAKLTIINSTSYKIEKETSGTVELMMASKRLTDGCIFQSPAANSTITFDLDGKATSNPQIVIENQGSTGHINVIANTGRVEVSYP
jgi:Tfp pilus assembly protein FimT